MRRFASIASGLFACVTGCGDDGGARHLADAPPTPEDAPIDSIPAGTVNVTTLVRCCDLAPNTPQAGVLVVAVNADGTLAGTATTDALGKASLSIKEGATVTAIYPETNSDNVLTSYVGVKPDDNLTFGEAYYTPNMNGGTTGTFRVNWTAVTGAVDYYLGSPCFTDYTGDVLTQSIGLQTTCQVPTTPLAIVALDGNNRPLASIYLPATAYAAGGTLNLTAGQWVANTTNNFSASMSGLPTSVYDAYFSSYADFGFFTWGDSRYGSIDTGVATFTGTVPTAAPRINSYIELYRSNYGSQYHYKTGPSPLTFAPTTLPWISGVIYSPADGHALWLQTAGTYDAATLELNWEHYEAKTYHYFKWNVILPPGQTEFEIGTPPAELAAFLPTAKDNVGYDLTLIDLSSAASYDALRALPEWRVFDSESAVRAGEEPSAGTSQVDGGEGFAFTH